MQGKNLKLMFEDGISSTKGIWGIYKRVGKEKKFNQAPFHQRIFVWTLLWPFAKWVWNLVYLVGGHLRAKFKLKSIKDLLSMWLRNQSGKTKLGTGRHGLIRKLDASFQSVLDLPIMCVKNAEQPYVTRKPRIASETSIFRNMSLCYHTYRFWPLTSVLPKSNTPYFCIVILFPNN